MLTGRASWRQEQPGACALRKGCGPCAVIRYMCSRRVSGTSRCIARPLCHMEANFGKAGRRGTTWLRQNNAVLLTSTHGMAVQLVGTTEAWNGNTSKLAASLLGEAGADIQLGPIEDCCLKQRVQARVQAGVQGGTVTPWSQREP